MEVEEGLGQAGVAQTPRLPQRPWLRHKRLGRRRWDWNPLSCVNLVLLPQDFHMKAEFSGPWDVEGLSSGEKTAEEWVDLTDLLILALALSLSLWEIVYCSQPGFTQLAQSSFYTLSKEGEVPRWHPSNCSSDSFNTICLLCELRAEFIRLFRHYCQSFIWPVFHSRKGNNTTRRAL